MEEKVQAASWNSREAHSFSPTYIVYRIYIIIYIYNTVLPVIEGRMKSRMQILLPAYEKNSADIKKGDEVKRYRSTRSHGPLVKVLQKYLESSWLYCSMQWGIHCFWMLILTLKSHVTLKLQTLQFKPLHTWSTWWTHAPSRRNRSAVRPRFGGPNTNCNFQEMCCM